MARVMCIDDYPAYAEMVGDMLTRKGGHDVKSETVPISIKTIEAFDPDVVIVNLVRKMETISAGGMRDFYADVEGGKAFREIAHATREGRFNWAIVITSIAVLEHEVPRNDGLHYVAFVEIPQKLEQLSTIVEKVAQARKMDGPVAPE